MGWGGVGWGWVGLGWVGLNSPNLQLKQRRSNDCAHFSTLRKSQEHTKEKVRTGVEDDGNVGELLHRGTKIASTPVPDPAAGARSRLSPFLFPLPPLHPLLLLQLLQLLQQLFRAGERGRERRRIRRRDRRRTRRHARSHPHLQLLVLLLPLHLLLSLPPVQLRLRQDGRLDEEGEGRCVHGCRWQEPPATATPAKEHHQGPGTVPQAVLAAQRPQAVVLAASRLPSSVLVGRLGQPCIPAVMQGRGKLHRDRQPLVAKARAETSLSSASWRHQRRRP